MKAALIRLHDTRFFGKILTIDDLVMLTERDEFVYHEMLTHIPLCSLLDPKRVLVIGGGDCGIVREVLRHPVEHVVQCEIDERVTAVCAEHFPWVKGVQSDPRCELVFDDGVTFMETHQGEFDLVIVDSTDPVGPAVGLFQRAFYTKVGRALRPGGVMVAQTESPHWAASVVGGIYEELRHGFEHVHAYMGFIPTYPSGSWCWAYTSNDRRPVDFFDLERAAKISEGCRYYNPGIQAAAFVLPTFAEQAIRGENPFREFDQRNREQ